MSIQIIYSFLIELLAFYCWIVRIIYSGYKFFNRYTICIDFLLPCESLFQMEILEFWKLTFMCLIHWVSFFVCIMVSKGPTTLLCIWMRSYPSTICGVLHFPHGTVLAPLWKMNCPYIGQKAYSWTLSCITLLCQYHTVLVTVTL